MKKKIIYILLSSLLVIILIIVLNPLRRSGETIRKKLLKLTPSGTSMDKVVAIVKKNKKWELVYVSTEYGYGIMHNGLPSSSGVETIGVKSMRVDLGEYHTIFWTGVVVFYGLDEDSKLIDIAVRKDYDTL